MIRRAILQHPALRPVALICLVAVGACSRVPQPDQPAWEELAAGRRYQHTVELRIRNADSLPHARDAISAGYLARARLGLGSPFRLAEYALRDPRLDPASRRLTAWALLASTSDRRGSVVDPAALGDHGASHLNAIDQSIREAAEPRSGELAVRLAYQLAEAERSVPRATRRAADRAAAILRDREQARRDVARLLDESRSAGKDPMANLMRWRRERRFGVEKPLGGPDAVATEDAAMRLLPSVMARVRLAAAARPDSQPALEPVLSARAARALLRLADSINPPPRPGIVIPVRQLVPEYRRLSGTTAAERRRLERFAAGARDEERFAAEHALAAAELGTPTARAALAFTALETAVSMATQGQERVWHAGNAGPDEVELQWRYGLESVEFSPRIPDPWRPYLLYALDGALADWSAVFPASTLRGVRIWFGAEGVPPRALAIHSPRTRHVRLPAETGLGNLAHELAHELDRAESERRYDAPHRYATDDAVSRGRQDAFAAASRGILVPPTEGPNAGQTPEWDYLSRPAEIFARNVDWYVASALADRGRMNGDLSTVQDELLSGFGNVDHVAAVDSAAEALVQTLLLMVPMPRADLRRFAARYSPALTPRPGTLAEGITRAPRLVEGRFPADSAGRERFLEDARRDIQRVRRAAAAARLTHARCGDGLTLPRGLAPTPAARQELIRVAEDAGVRLVVHHYASRLAGGAGRRWLAQGASVPDPASGVTAERATWLRRLIWSAEISATVDPLMEPLRCTALAATS
jgi:hypothetical protein